MDRLRGRASRSARRGFLSLQDQAEVGSPDTLRLNGFAERGLSLLEVTQVTTRVYVKNLFLDIKFPSTSDYFGAETMN